MSAKTASVTTTLEDHVGYVEARKRLAGLRRDLAACEAAMLATASDEERAERLAAGDAADTGPDLAAIEGRQRVLTRACELAERQYREVLAAASEELVRERRSEHVELVRQIAAAMLALTTAMQAEQSWWDGLRASGIQAKPGAGGTASYVSGESRELFRLLRGFRIEPWLERLTRAGYRLARAK
ncbi:MAG: hypothetical protein PHN77_18260 [Thermoguttaceae bacterium]|nr:hypothetical protein [Thermoguttaceae bacterium]